MKCFTRDITWAGSVPRRVESMQASARICTGLFRIILANCVTSSKSHDFISIRTSSSEKHGSKIPVFPASGLLCKSNKRTDRYNRFKANSLDPIHSNTAHIFLQVLLADSAPWGRSIVSALKGSEVKGLCLGTEKI